MGEEKNNYWYWQDPKSRVIYERCTMNHEEKSAISVIDEAANKYYQSFGDMPESIRKKISYEMLHNIFKHMVAPAIDEVRRLDRNT